MRTQRCKGLQLLNVYGLPTPSIQFVKVKSEIETLQLAEAPHGWTIRTCSKNGIDEFGLFNRNYLSSTKVKEELENRYRYGSDDYYYIVYPSWKFLLSMNILLVGIEFIIEGNYSSQESISKGTGLPDFSLIVPMGFLSKIEMKNGSLTLEVKNYIVRILNLLKNLPFESYYTEVAVKQDGDIIFYELWRLE